LNGLNDNHRRVLLATFRHIDELLASVETACAGSSSPFARQFADLAPTQRRVVEDYTTHLRARMAEALRMLGIGIEPPRIAASWAIQTAISFAQIGLQEIAPERLSGYGALDGDSAATLRSLEADLDRAMRRLQAYLVQGLGRDPAERLARLERAPVDLGLLRRLERVITARGFVEFRGALDALLDRIEAETFEIAVFGRVSSGKSSLLNAVLGFGALPVGVTPITAVPTRVAWGERSDAEIRFAERAPERVPLERLKEFVSEQHNPDNQLRVIYAEVRLPSDILRSGIVFVDTPGVGSLSTGGARESYAYLPRCDLGILLLDSASAPTREDLEILRLLSDSGIPAMAVLSKADLVSEEDLERLRNYIHSRISSELGMEMTVHAVSTVGDRTKLERDWFAREIRPLSDRTRELARASARRKLETLREGVAATLRAELGRPQAGREADRPGAIEQTILEAEARLRKATSACESLVEHGRELARPVLEAAARATARPPSQDLPQAIGRAVARIAAEASEEIRGRLRAELLALRGDLDALLRRMAKDAGTDPSQSESLSLDLVTEPALSIPEELANLEIVGRNLWELSSGAYERRVRRDLIAGIGKPLEESFSSFHRALAGWLRTTLARLSSHFAAQAEPLRALTRRASGRGGSADREGLEADLAAIEGGGAVGTETRSGAGARADNITALVLDVEDETA